MASGKEDRLSAEEVWIAVAVTDRSDSFDVLCADLTRQAMGAGVRLGFAVVENSRHPFARAANHATMARLVSSGARVMIDESSAGDTIERSRVRSRALLKRAQGAWPEPRFVWMLDDDVRLLHLVWRDGYLAAASLHNHIAFLLDLAVTRDLDVLIGEVTGDPPIPPIATLTTRLADLAWNLREMSALDPKAEWSVDDRSLQLIADHDAYYDFSVDAAPEPWTKSPRWLPTRPGVTVESARAEMLSEARHIPLGIAFTRPIIAEPTAFDLVASGTRRGGNAVFFQLEACLEHDYPVAAIRGMRTRRSDMVGARLLAARRPGRVKTSRFSVLHRRARHVAWPTREELAISLVTDTLGSSLARSVEGALSGRGASLMAPRLARIRESLAALPRILLELESLATLALAQLHPESSILHDLTTWARREVPGAVDGILEAGLVDALVGADVQRAIEQRVVELTATFALEAP